MLTIAVVFGHCPQVAKMWIETHLKVIPADQTVFLVENLFYPEYEVTYWLMKGCAEREKWVLYSTLRAATPINVYFSHGKALDLILPYINTKYVLTMDSDAFLVNFETVERMLELAETNDATIVGHVKDNMSIPYIVPCCALYRVDFARKVGFSERRYKPELPAQYMQFYRPQANDEFAQARRTYMDIGQKIYLDAVLEGRAVVNYEPNVKHLWGSTPFIFMHKGEFYRTGRFGRKIHTYI